MAIEKEPIDVFEQMVGAWRKELEAKKPSDYTPTDWRILALLQLRDAWLMRGQGLDSSKPLGSGPLTGLRRLDTPTAPSDGFSPSQN